MSRTAEELRVAPAAVPGEPGLWLFVLADMTMFAVLFGVLVELRAHQHELFVQSQAHLNRGLGALNTLLLLTGSMFVALAVGRARRGLAHADRLLIAAMGCGIAFLGVKVIEWGSKIADGITPQTNDFFSAYYMLTGIHLAHVCIGLGVLLAMLRNVRGAALKLGLLEGGGCYWHLVDLLWVVLFPLLYLMR